MRRVHATTDFKARSDSGMTLIDMAIFMMVIGLLAVPLIQSYNGYVIKKGGDETRAHMGIVDRAIGEFYFLYDRYPCPSDINLPVTDPNYGKQNCPVAAPVPGNVLHGGVPFADLKIPESESLDGWGNRIRYAVTDEQRVGAPAFDATGGGIDVWRFQRLPIVPPATMGVCTNTVINMTPAPNQSHYVLVSNGGTGAGAVSSTGQNAGACPLPGTSQDSDNCIDDASFFWHECATSDTPGALFYDDVMYSRSNIHQKIWVNNALDTNDIVSIAAKIGINNGNPWPNPAPMGAPTGIAGSGMDVRGNVLATNDPGNVNNTGNINSDNICDENGNNCFNPNMIASPAGLPTMNCQIKGAGNTAVQGIWLGEAQCSGSYLPAAASNCGGGRAEGFDATGQLTCKP